MKVPNTHPATYCCFLKKKICCTCPEASHAMLGSHDQSSWRPSLQSCWRLRWVAVLAPSWRTSSATWLRQRCADPPRLRAAARQATSHTRGHVGGCRAAGLGMVALGTATIWRTSAAAQNWQRCRRTRAKPSTSRPAAWLGCVWSAASPASTANAPA